MTTQTAKPMIDPKFGSLLFSNLLHKFAQTIQLDQTQKKMQQSMLKHFKPKATAEPIPAVAIEIAILTNLCSP